MLRSIVIAVAMLALLLQGATVSSVAAAVSDAASADGHEIHAAASDHARGHEAHGQHGGTDREVSDGASADGCRHVDCSAGMCCPGVDLVVPVQARRSVAEPVARTLAPAVAAASLPRVPDDRPPRSA